MLVTPDDVRRQLHINFHDEDAHLIDLISQSSEIVRDYLKAHRTGVAQPEWTPDTAPFNIKAATLIILTRLYEDREARFQGAQEGHLSPPVNHLLERYRDPALA